MNAEVFNNVTVPADHRHAVGDTVRHVDETESGTAEVIALTLRVVIVDGSLLMMPTYDLMDREGEIIDDVPCSPDLVEG